MMKNIRGREARGINQKATWEALQTLCMEDEPNKQANTSAATLHLYK